MEWIAKIVLDLLKWAFGKTEENTNVKLGRVEAEKDAAEAELSRVDRSIGARDNVHTDYDSLYNDPANRSNDVTQLRR